MLRHIAVSCIFTSVFLISQAHANCSVAPIPLEAFLTAQPDSTTGGPGVWNFEMDGFNFPPTTLLASVGRFVATLGTDRSGATIGILSITQTTSIDGSIARLETDIGRFKVNPGCETGTLTFNTSSRPAQFDFFVVSINEI